MRFLFPLVLLLAASVWAQSPPAWVARSNQNAQLLITILARYAPEQAAAEGVEGLDEQISSSKPDEPERVRKDLASAREELEKRLAAERDPLVRQDLEILIAQANRDIRSSEASERNLLPYDDVAGTIFYGIKSLLDEQIAANRRPASLVRLRKYTGLDPAYEPLTVQAEQRFREKLKTPGLVGPSKVEVEKNLENTQAYVTGIGLLLSKVQDDRLSRRVCKAQGAARGLRRVRARGSAAESAQRLPASSGVVHYLARELRNRLYARRIDAPGSRGVRAIAKRDAAHRGQDSERAASVIVRLSQRDS